MSNDSLLSIAVCCLSCTLCCDVLNETNTNNTNNMNNIDLHHNHIDHSYKKLDDKSNNPKKSTKIVCRYLMSDTKFSRNDNMEPICVLCNDVIDNPKMAVVECNLCKQYIGHPICYINNKFVCPLCQASGKI